MAFVVLSWNIEHMRTEKVTRNEDDINNLRAFYNVLVQADIAFLYECKDKGVADEVLEILNQPKRKLAKATDSTMKEMTTFKWNGEAYSVGGNEVVLCFWKETSVKSVERLTGVEAKFRGLNLGERWPACVLVTTTSDHTFSAGAWHCAGPAVTMAKEAKQRFLDIGGLNLLFGDMNFQSPLNQEPYNPDPRFLLVRQTSIFGTPELVKDAPERQLTPYTGEKEKEEAPSYSDFFSDPLKYGDLYGKGKSLTAMQEVHSCGSQTPSTYTESGSAKRWTGPIDRVFANDSIISSVQVVQGTGLDLERAIRLTNHFPVFIIINL